MDMERVISLYMDECASKQLREKTMQSYEKTLKRFTVWLKENEKTDRVEDIEDRTIRRYVLDLQTRGKYTVCADKTTKDINYPQRRRDYNKKVSNITINNYQVSLMLARCNLFFYARETCEFTPFKKTSTFENNWCRTNGSNIFSSFCSFLKRGNQSFVVA